MIFTKLPSPDVRSDVSPQLSRDEIGDEIHYPLIWGF